MKILVAPDKFRGTLTSTEAARAIALGVHDVMPDAEVITIPMADGGEGTAAILAAAHNPHEWELHTATIPSPLPGLPDNEVEYYINPVQRLALLDSSAAVGLNLIPADKRDPLRATTKPLGVLLATIIERHDPREITIGLGGTATCDAGLGMVIALEEAHVKVPQLLGLYDVAVPLVAPIGKHSALTFVEQKGAKGDDIAILQKRLVDACKKLPGADPDTLGAGAAGGLGYAILALGGTLISGSHMCAAARLDDLHPDLLITGEGSIDAQSELGKVLIFMAAYANSEGIPSIAIGGRVTSEGAMATLFTVVVAADAYPPAGPLTPDGLPTPEVAAARLRAATADILNIKDDFNSLA